MDMLGKYKNIIIAIVVIALAFVAYQFFFTGDGGSDNLLVSQNPSETGAVSQEILTLLLELRSLTLRGDIFDAPAFISLRDYSVELTPQPVGRENPFAPVGN